VVRLRNRKGHAWIKRRPKSYVLLPGTGRSPRSAPGPLQQLIYWIKSRPTDECTQAQRRL